MNRRNALQSSALVLRRRKNPGILEYWEISRAGAAPSPAKYPLRKIRSFPGAAFFGRYEVLKQWREWKRKIRSGARAIPAALRRAGKFQPRGFTSQEQLVSRTMAWIEKRKTVRLSDRAVTEVECLR